MKRRFAVLTLAVFAAACSEGPTQPSRGSLTPVSHGPARDVTPAASANLVVNGSFEQPAVVPSPYPWATFQTGSSALTGWTIESGTVDIQSGDWNGSAYPFTGVPNGTQVADMNTATISQTISTTPGMTYQVSFDMSENYVILGGGTVSLEVDFGGTAQSFTFSDPSGSSTNMRWDAHSFTATATSSSTTLRIKVTGGGNWAGGPMLDAVQVQPPSVFTSGANVQTWDPIFPASADPTWGTTSCTAQPAVGLNANWQNPHNAFVLYGHPWAGAYFQAPWINAWNSLPSQGPDGQSYTKYQTPVTGNGTFVLQLLADNCSWVYIDNQLVGVQNTDLSHHTYSVTLNGPATLSFIIFDGGGAAGGKFRLETYSSYAANGGDTTTVHPLDNTPPVITPTVSGTQGDASWYTSDVSVTWAVTDGESAISSKTGCDAASVSSDTNGQTFTCTATSAGGTATKSVTVKRDATPPSIAFAGNNGSYTVDQSVAITCSATDAMSGMASSTCPGANADAYTFSIGSHTLNASATDVAGNSATGSTSFTVQVTASSLCALVDRWVNQHGIANSMCQQLNNGAYGAFRNHVQAQSGKSVSAEHAAILIRLSQYL